MPIKLVECVNGGVVGGGEGGLIRVRWICGATAPRCSWYGLSASDRPISNAKWVSNVIQIFLKRSGLAVGAVGGRGAAFSRAAMKPSSARLRAAASVYFRITGSLTRLPRLFLQFDCYPEGCCELGGVCESTYHKCAEIKTAFQSNWVQIVERQHREADSCLFQSTITFNSVYIPCC